MFGALLPPELEQGDDHIDGQEEGESGFFPAIAHKKIPAYQHQPVPLKLPFGREGAQPKIRVLRIGNLSDEQWKQRNNEAAEWARGRQEKIDRNDRENNVGALQ